MPQLPASVAAAAVTLAIILAVSGLAKLRDPQATRESFVTLRLPSRFVQWRLPSLLPWAELALAAALLVVPAPVFLAVALAALALVAAYLLIVVRAVRFDEPVTCSCFGAIGGGTLSRWTIVRNLLLTGLAGLTAWDGLAGGSTISHLLNFEPADWLWLGLAGAAAALAVLIVIDRPATASRADAEEGDYLRQPIPYGRLAEGDGDGPEITFRELLTAKPVLLVLVSLGCGGCLSVLEELPAFVATNPELEVVIATFAPVPPDDTRLPAGTRRMVDTHRDLVTVFGMAAPSAVLFGADRLLAGGPVIGSTAVLGFFSEVTAELDQVRLISAP